MTDEKREARVERLRALLEPLAKRLPTGDAHWVFPGSGECKLYCADCIDDALAKAKEDDPAYEFEIYGGSQWGTDDDSCARCGMCGIFLPVWLTEDGVESECEHFEENGVGFNDDDAAHVLQILESAQCSHGDVEMVDRVLALCEPLFGWRFWLQRLKFCFRGKENGHD